MGYDAKEYHPIDIIHERHGLYAKIYRSLGSGGTFYTVEFDRAGYYDGKLAITQSFRQHHLLSLAQLARRCHDRVLELKAT